MLALERGHHVKKLASSENALSVLQCEAGPTDDTLNVLRKAVSAELAVLRPGEASEASQGGSRKCPFEPSSSKRQQLTAEEAAEVVCSFKTIEEVRQLAGQRW
jgi:hypothetical protein